MITPRRTQLVRVRTAVFRHDSLARSSGSGSGFWVPVQVRVRVQGSPTRNPEPTEPGTNPEPGPRTQNRAKPSIVVPTRGAADPAARAGGGCDATLVTRDELYDQLHARLADPPRRLSALERDVIAQAAARAAARPDGELSFQLRPGLVAEMLRFYDHLRRQSQQVNRFEELIGEALGSDDVDRATARMRTQTRFLAEAFREYERRVRDSGGCDEHVLRERLMAETAIDPVRHVIVTVPDWIADADGFYSADFDLLARIPGSRRSTSSPPSVCLHRASTSGCTTGGRDWKKPTPTRERLAADPAHPAWVRRRRSPGGRCAIARKSW